MYGIDKDTQSEAAGFTGIQENFELVNVRYGKISAKEDKTAVGLVFEFKRGENFTLPVAIFPVNETNAAQYRNKKKDKEGKLVEETKEEAVKRAYEEQAVFIKHIMTKYIPEDKIIIPKVNSFEQFANTVISLLGNSFKGVKIRLVLIYNKKGMLTLPRFPKFIELMSVNPSQLTITEYHTKWLKKPVADKDAAATTGTTAPISTPSGEDF